jgi:hypothetical protein
MNRSGQPQTRIRREAAPQECATDGAPRFREGSVSGSSFGSNTTHGVPPAERRFGDEDEPLGGDVVQSVWRCRHPLGGWSRSGTGRTAPPTVRAGLPPIGTAEGLLGVQRPLSPLWIVAHPGQDLSAGAVRRCLLGPTGNPFTTLPRRETSRLVLRPRRTEHQEGIRLPGCALSEGRGHGDVEAEAPDAARGGHVLLQQVEHDGRGVVVPLACA